MSSSSVASPFSAGFVFNKDPLEAYQKNSIVTLSERVKNCCHLLFRTNVGIVCAANVLSGIVFDVYSISMKQKVGRAFLIVAASVVIPAYLHHCLPKTIEAAGIGVMTNFIAMWTGRLFQDLNVFNGWICSGVGMGLIIGICSFIFGNIVASTQPEVERERIRDSLTIGTICQRMGAWVSESIHGGVGGSVTGLFSSLLFLTLVETISKSFIQEVWFEEEATAGNFDQWEEERAVLAFVKAIRSNYLRSQPSSTIQEETDSLSVPMPCMFEKMAQIAIAELIANPKAPSEKTTPRCFHAKISGKEGDPSLLDKILSLRSLFQKGGQIELLDKEVGKLAYSLILQNEQTLPGINLFRRALTSVC